MAIKYRSVVGKFDDVVERLFDRLGEGNVYRIDEDGTIELISGGKRLLVKANS